MREHLQRRLVLALAAAGVLSICFESAAPRAAAPRAAAPVRHAPAAVTPASPAPSAAGGEPQPCYGNATCNAGLVCGSGICVKIPTAPPQ